MKKPWRILTLKLKNKPNYILHIKLIKNYCADKNDNIIFV